MNRLYTFWRSSAAYRLRIALNLKGLEYEPALVHFRKEGGQHRKPEFLEKNPQGLLPVWEEDGWYLNQSLAIIEYLDETHPETSLLPSDVKKRAEARAAAQVIACDIHPLNNLRVLGYLKATLGHAQDDVNEWYRHWVRLGFDALEPVLSRADSVYAFGDAPGIVDCCLVPQVYNARRFDCDLSDYPVIVDLDDRLNRIDAFKKAAPESQSDAEMPG